METLKELKIGAIFHKGDFLYIPSNDEIVRIDKISKNGKITLTHIEIKNVRGSMILSRTQFEDLFVQNLMNFDPIIVLE
jgi:hypothetical protein